MITPTKKEYQRYVIARLLNQKFYFVTAKRLPLSVFREYTTMIYLEEPGQGGQPNQEHSLRVGWRNLPTLRVGWRNFFSSYAVVSVIGAGGK
jgi:hypothetical protein